MSRLLRSWSVFDIAAKQRELAEIESSSASNNFWDDAQNAQRLMRRASQLKSEIDNLTFLDRRILDAIELASFGDVSLEPELDAEISDLHSRVDEIEFTTLMSGKFDREDSILAIHAGTGGVDAMDWAAMLERMYFRWCERRGFKSEQLDRSSGEENGLKSVTIAISGEWSYGYLNAERGVHRLVRLSPFDSAHRRHTSFALVEVWPDVRDDTEIALNPSDLIIETYRSSGAGGQNVQKNETAVRITHKPSGIVVTCQNERSLTQNRESALRVLRARLIEAESERQEAERAKLKGEHIDANFGNQIRSYVLHPYQMVKDHRTSHESSNTGAVLDGQIDDFIQAFLRAR